MVVMAKRTRRSDAYLSAYIQVISPVFLTNVGFFSSVRVVTFTPDNNCTNVSCGRSNSVCVFSSDPDLLLFPSSLSFPLVVVMKQIHEALGRHEGFFLQSTQIRLTAVNLCLIVTLRANRSICEQTRFYQAPRPGTCPHSSSSSLLRNGNGSAVFVVVYFAVLHIFSFTLYFESFCRLVLFERRL